MCKFKSLLTLYVRHSSHSISWKNDSLNSSGDKKTPPNYIIKVVISKNLYFFGDNLSSLEMSINYLNEV